MQNIREALKAQQRTWGIIVENSPLAQKEIKKMAKRHWSDTIHKTSVVNGMVQEHNLDGEFYCAVRVHGVFGQATTNENSFLCRVNAYKNALASYQDYVSCLDFRRIG